MRVNQVKAKADLQVAVALIETQESSLRTEVCQRIESALRLLRAAPCRQCSATGKMLHGNLCYACNGAGLF